MLTINQNSWEQLHHIFRQDLTTTTNLLEQLQKEQAALEARDYEQFQQILQVKQSLLVSLESHLSQRQHWLQTTGFADEASVLAAAKMQAPNVATTWHALEQQWLHCQELNTINEHIASRTRAVVTQVLDALRGQNSQLQLYTVKGNTLSGNSGRTISNA